MHDLFPTDWRTMMTDVVSPRINKVFGEIMIVCPAMHNEGQNVNERMTPIRDRRFRVRGVFRLRSDIVLKPSAPFTHKGSAASVETRKPVAEFDAKELLQCGVPLQQGFYIHRLLSGETYQVTSTAPDGVARVVCHLNQCGVPEGVF